MGRSARRVFLSHTSDLRKYPAGGSFVDAAEKAVLRLREAPVDMAYFAAGVLVPAALCRARVSECDVYVLVAGFRYGSPVVDRPSSSSYTELEFEAATELGKPRLVFVLDEESEGPGALFRDPEFGDRQEAFRRRLLLDGGLTVKTVRTPAELDAALVHALTELRVATPGGPDAAVADGSVEPDAPRVWKVPARLQGFTGREGLLRELARSSDDGPVVVRAIEGMGGVGKSSTVIEYPHRHAADHHGPDHTTTLHATSCLANRLRALGGYQAARQFHEDTLTRQRRVLGEDHPDTLSSANNLAVDLCAVGEHQAARALDEDTLTRRRRVLGENDPNTLRTAHNLVAVLRDLDEHDQADVLQTWIDATTTS